MVDQATYKLMMAQHLCRCLKPRGPVVIELHPRAIGLPLSNGIMTRSAAIAMVQHNSTKLVCGGPSICLSLLGNELGHLQLHGVLQTHGRLDSCNSAPLQDNTTQHEDQPTFDLAATTATCRVILSALKLASQDVLVRTTMYEVAFTFSFLALASKAAKCPCMPSMVHARRAVSQLLLYVCLDSPLP